MPGIMTVCCRCCATMATCLTGKLRVSLVNAERFTDEEDEASAIGLQAAASAGWQRVGIFRSGRYQFHR